VHGGGHRLLELVALEHGRSAGGRHVGHGAHSVRNCKHTQVKNGLRIIPQKCNCWF
jgi:hypothetical protein